MNARRAALVAFVSVIVALLVANALGDSFRLLGSGDLRSTALAIVVVGVVGAAYGAAHGRLLDVALGRSAAIAALSAALVAFVLVRLPSPWLDLGPFGAGPITAIAVLVLPIAQLCAVFAVKRWATKS